MDIAHAIRLASARHMVNIDHRVADGDPTVGATGVRVAEVAAMLERSPLDQVSRAFPVLSMEQVALCGLYVDTLSTADRTPKVRVVRKRL